MINMYNRLIISIICLCISFLILTFGIPTIMSKTYPKKDVLQVVRYVPKGEIISSKDIKVITIGDYNLPENILTNPELVIGKTAKIDFVEGDFLLSNKISKPKEVIT